MAYPTEPKIRKIRTDGERVRGILQRARTTATEMTGNPKGSNVELCKDIRRAMEKYAEASKLIKEAEGILEGPERILLNRKRK